MDCVRLLAAVQIIVPQHLQEMKDRSENEQMQPGTGFIN